MNIDIDKSNLPLMDLKFLVIDDSSFVRRMVWNALKGFGVIKVFEAKDAVAGLEMLRNRGNNIDIVIVDYEMPMMDGTEFTNLVRHDKNLPNPNVIIIMSSSHTEAGMIADAKRAGIDGFLVKPFSANDLKNRVLSILKKKSA